MDLHPHRRSYSQFKCLNLTVHGVLRNEDGILNVVILNLSCRVDKGKQRQLNWDGWSSSCSC
uniref:40S ribosomal protein S30 n=1 Tax=Solanum tuberosum TaxID=4113 RepID=M0ZHA5_SOLTU